MLNLAIAVVLSGLLPRALPFWPLTLAGARRHWRVSKMIQWKCHAASAVILVCSALLSPWLLVFAALGISLSLFDLRYQILPDLLSFAFALAGLFFLVFGSGPAFASATLGALVGGGLLWVVRYSFEALRGEEGLGFGDVKLAMGLGIWVGVLAIGWVIAGAAILGIGCALVTAQRRIAFGPALLLAAWVVIVAKELGAVG